MDHGYPIYYYYYGGGITMTRRKTKKMMWSQPARDRIIAEREEAAANSEARKEQYLKSEKYREKRAWDYYVAELKSKSGCLDEDTNTYTISTAEYTIPKDPTIDTTGFTEIQLPSQVNRKRKSMI
jgi:hypothetical protein